MVVGEEGQLLRLDALALSSEDTGFWNMMFLLKSAELVDHTSSAGNLRTSSIHGCSYMLREEVVTRWHLPSAMPGKLVSLVAVVLLVTGSHVSLTGIELDVYIKGAYRHVPPCLAHAELKVESKDLVCVTFKPL